MIDTERKTTSLLCFAKFLHVVAEKSEKGSAMGRWLPQLSLAKKLLLLGRGGGLVVSVIAFHSSDPSSNPAGYLNPMYKKTKIDKKEARVGPSFFKKLVLLRLAGQDLKE